VTSHSYVISPGKAGKEKRGSGNHSFLSDPKGREGGKGGEEKKRSSGYPRSFAFTARFRPRMAEKGSSSRKKKKKGDASLITFNSYYIQGKADDAVEKEGKRGLAILFFFPSYSTLVHGQKGGGGGRGGGN